MLKHRSFRSLFVVLVLALLATPWPAEARSSEAHRVDAAASPPIESFIGWLVALWGEVGCTMDPNGSACRENLDSACGWDPNGGGCRESLDAGCTWDPDGGGCRENLDEACTWDPNGGGCRDHG